MALRRLTTIDAFNKVVNDAQGTGAPPAQLLRMTSLEPTPTEDGVELRPVLVLICTQKFGADEYEYREVLHPDSYGQVRLESSPLWRALDPMLNGRGDQAAPRAVLAHRSGSL